MKTLSVVIAGLSFLVTLSAQADTKLYKGSAIAVIKPEKVARFKVALSRIMAETRKEPGNISYDAFQILSENGKETNRFEFRERWISKDALMDQHMNSKHMKAFFDEVKASTDDSFFESLDISGELVNQI